MKENVSKLVHLWVVLDTAICFKLEVARFPWKWLQAMLPCSIDHQMWHASGAAADLEYTSLSAGVIVIISCSNIAVTEGRFLNFHHFQSHYNY